jgi:hypothetical protein
MRKERKKLTPACVKHLLYSDIYGAHQDLPKLFNPFSHLLQFFCICDFKCCFRDPVIVAIRGVGFHLHSLFEILNILVFWKNDGRVPY